MQINSGEDLITDNLDSYLNKTPIDNDKYYGVMNKAFPYDYNKNLNYEDPILSNEIFKQMKELKKNLIDEGIAVAHSYFDYSPNKKYYYPLAEVGYPTSDEGKNPEMTGKYFAVSNPKAKQKYGNIQDPDKKIYEYFEDFPEGIENMPGINVPMTPTLDNYFTMAEEAAHARHMADKNETGEYDKRAGNVKEVGPLQALTGRTDEEFIAKDIAKQTMGGYLTPDTQALMDATKQRYVNRLMQKVYADQYEYDKRKNPDTVISYLNSLLDGGVRYNRIDDAYDAVGITPKEFALKEFDRYYPFFSNDKFLNFKPKLAERNKFINFVENDMLRSNYYPYEDPINTFTNFELTDEDIAGFQTYEDFKKQRSRSDK